MFQTELIRPLCLGVALLASGAASASLRAQQAASPLRAFPSEVICARGKAPIIDTAVVTVAIGAASNRTDSLLTPSARDRATFMAQELRPFFQAPSPLTYPKPLVWGSMEAPEIPAEARPFRPFGGHITVAFNDFERVVAVRASEALVNEGLRDALTEAVMRADSAGVFKGLRMGSIVRPDTVLLELVASEEPPALAVQLFRSRVEYLPFERPVRMVRAGTLVYPAIAEQSGIEASVDLQFIVGANGEPHSIRPLTQTYREFLQAAGAAVQETRFKPAEAGGCRVSQLVQQRLSFKLP